MRLTFTSITHRKRQDGIATVIMLILVAMILGFIIANIATLSSLHNDVKRLEQRQIRRLNSTAASASTNAPAVQPVQ